MHPRIKERYLDNLETQKALTVGRANEIVATQVTDLEKLVSIINKVNDAGTLKIPKEFTEFYSDTIKTFRQLDLESTENLQLVQKLLLTLTLVNQQFVTHTHIQVTKHNAELCLSDLAAESA